MLCVFHQQRDQGYEVDIFFVVCSSVNFTEHHPQFFTATILEWKHLLKEDKYKDIILDSLRFLVKEKRVVVNSFVLISNHIHLIWQAINGCTPQQNQQRFLKYTAQQIKFDLQKNNLVLLEEFRVNAKDRMFARLTGRAGILGTEFFEY